MRILVLEQDDIAWDKMAACLRGDGADVVRCKRGDEAVAQALAQGFDVLVLVREGEEPDGLSVLKTLREASVQTPVMFVSAVSVGSRRIEAFELGADDFLGKPYDGRELQLRVRNLWRRGGISAPTRLRERF